MVNNLRTYLACFMKFEVIKDLSVKKIKDVDIITNVRQPRTFFFGDGNENLISKTSKNKNYAVIVKDFLSKLECLLPIQARCLHFKKRVYNQ